MADLAINSSHAGRIIDFYVPDVHKVGIAKIVQKSMATHLASYDDEAGVYFKAIVDCITEQFEASKYELPDLWRAVVIDWLYNNWNEAGQFAFKILK